MNPFICLKASIFFFLNGWKQLQNKPLRSCWMSSDRLHASTQLELMQVQLDRCIYNDHRRNYFQNTCSISKWKTTAYTQHVCSVWPAAALANIHTFHPMKYCRNIKKQKNGKHGKKTLKQRSFCLKVWRLYLLCIFTCEIYRKKTTENKEKIKRAKKLRLFFVVVVARGMCFTRDNWIDENCKAVRHTKNQPNINTYFYI